MKTSIRRPALALVAIAAVLVGGTVGTSAQVPTLAEPHEPADVTAVAEGVTGDEHGHDHSDPATKNSISRSGDAEGIADPTTRGQAAAAASYVDRMRALPDPQLAPTAAYPTRSAVPTTRYAMAGGCYRIGTADGRYVVRDGGAVAVAAVPAAEASGFRFKATRLGGYLLHTAAGEVGLVDGAITADADPAVTSDWTVRKVAGGFSFRLPSGEGLRRSGATLVAGVPTTFTLHRAGGCARYPEAQVNVTGAPHGGITDFQEVRGYVDAHTHGMAFEFLGGDVHCGRPWHSYGAPAALVDCVDHAATGGNGALLEAFLSGEPTHDPVGWPTFKDWPAPNSLTHEGTYYRWLERAWRGGQRILVNLLVENNKLCELYPLKHNSCDDMDSVRLQAADMYAMQDYIDAQFGGPGRGFYRIVTDPFQARRVINAGKLAVVIGIETSIPFGCTFKRVAGQDVPACTAEEIDANLDEMRALGVRQMELVNKFDNALAGVAGDGGEVGVVINGANFLETGTFWDMEHCEPADGESHDNPQLAVPEISAEQQDALFGALGALFGGSGVLPAVPIYPQPEHCNARGLTDLGVHTVEGLAERRMLFDPDHLSVNARSASMDVIERLGYHGVLSSHSWSTPDTYPRIYDNGGFIAPYAGDSTGFVAKWRRHIGWADSRYYWGIGFGADINGFGAQGGPRGTGTTNPVTYPFAGLGGTTVHQQRAGQRVWDINVDGVAQYGLYPDWVEDLRLIAEAEGGDGAAIVDDLARGSEAYLQTWERAVGIAPDSCRNPELRMSVAEVRRVVQAGMTTRQVMTVVGQPFRRLGSSFGVCATTATDPRVMVTIAFDGAGRVTGVGR